MLPLPSRFPASPRREETPRARTVRVRPCAKYAIALASLRIQSDQTILCGLNLPFEKPSRPSPQFQLSTGRMSRIGRSSSTATSPTPWTRIPRGFHGSIDARFVDDERDFVVAAGHVLVLARGGEVDALDAELPAVEVESDGVDGRLSIGRDGGHSRQLLRVGSQNSSGDATWLPVDTVSRQSRGVALRVAMVKASDPRQSYGSRIRRNAAFDGSASWRKNRVVVMDQELARGLVGECLAKLLNHPRHGRMLADVEVQDFAAAMGDREPDEEHFEADCRDN